MIKLLAKGNGWEITHETHAHTMDRTYLRLFSEFGVVEIMSFDGTVLHALEKAELEYNRLKAMGPIVPSRKGYKMSKVTAIEVRGERVAIVLACGHTVLCYPHGGLSVEEYAQSIQTGINPFEIGKSRVRCEQHRESVVQS